MTPGLCLALMKRIYALQGLNRPVEDPADYAGSGAVFCGYLLLHQVHHPARVQKTARSRAAYRALTDAAHNTPASKSFSLSNSARGTLYMYE